MNYDEKYPGAQRADCETVAAVRSGPDRSIPSEMIVRRVRGAINGYEQCISDLGFPSTKYIETKNTPRSAALNAARAATFAEIFAAFGFDNPK